MPGWYVHMDAARQTAERLRGGQLPAGFAINPAEAQDLGEVCHTWRNYLALGSLGPDLFYMLPDFKNGEGAVIRQVVQWALDVWEEIDAEFVSKWEKWIDPVSTNASQLASQLTGGLSAQLGQILNELGDGLTQAHKCQPRRLDHVFRSVPVQAAGADDLPEDRTEQTYEVVEGSTVAAAPPLEEARGVLPHGRGVGG